LSDLELNNFNYSPNTSKMRELFPSPLCCGVVVVAVVVVVDLSLEMIIIIIIEGKK